MKFLFATSLLCLANSALAQKEVPIYHRLVDSAKPPPFTLRATATINDGEPLYIPVEGNKIDVLGKSNALYQVALGAPDLGQDQWDFASAKAVRHLWH